MLSFAFFWYSILFLNPTMTWFLHFVNPQGRYWEYISEGDSYSISMSIISICASLLVKYLHKSSIMLYSLSPVSPPRNGQKVIIRAHIFSFLSRVKILSASKSKFLLFWVCGLSLSSSTQRFPQNILKSSEQKNISRSSHTWCNKKL